MLRYLGPFPCMLLLILLTSKLEVVAATFCTKISCPCRESGVRSPRAVVLTANAAHTPERGGIGTYAGTRPEGSHGSGFRFMPMSTMPPEPSPVLVCLAGAYPGLTIEQLLAPQPLPFAPKGKWIYHRLTGDAVPTGFVVLPGSALLDAHPNSVGVVCSSTSLGLELLDGESHEVITLIDRSPQVEFDNTLFYAFGDGEGKVHIRWMEVAVALLSTFQSSVVPHITFYIFHVAAMILWELLRMEVFALLSSARSTWQEVPGGWEVLGRVLYTQLPYIPKPGGQSGFAETSDEFDF